MRKATPLLLIIVFIGLIMLSLSPIEFYSEFSYNVELNSEGDPILDSSGDVIYNLTEEDKKALDFNNYQNKIIADYSDQTTIIITIVLVLFAIAGILVMNQFMQEKRYRKRRR